MEKILAPGEALPRNWNLDGTTGYDFMDQVGALLHDAAGEAPLTHAWTQYTGRPGDFRDVERVARRQTLRDALPSELNATILAVHRVAQQDLTTRDLTLGATRHTVVELSDISRSIGCTQAFSVRVPPTRE